MTGAEAEEILDRIAASFVNPLRSPILWTPADAGLEFESVTFPSADGVPLEGWFIHADSDRLVIANHPMGFSRAGQPTSREPWQSIWGPSGNTMDVNFIPDYKILHDAGYNVLTYDLRNFGLSGAANGGSVTSGLLEARDVIGSVRYAKQRSDTAAMRTALFSRCLGANSTLGAMRDAPEEFAHLKGLVACQPVSDPVIMSKLLDIVGVGRDRLADLDERVIRGTSVTFGARPGTAWTRYVTVPTYLYAVRHDSLTEPEDIETGFEALGTKDKTLYWVEDSTRRWDGYLEFQRRPQPILDWLDAHIDG
ncbi:alpha/beta hydrolase family protein [Streptomyces sp. NPDC014882]|uniref:alpha/beta hydrolase family protein n=1 Tax=Streptomyces sp. NPDC014882 TaxID=3364927 RepID=UPI0036FA7078